MFVSFQFFHFRICTSLMILKKGSNKTTRSSVWYFELVYFLYFLHFLICKGLKTWKYGGHEASWSDVWQEYDSDCLARASRAYYLSYAFCLHVIVIITTCNLIITIIFSSLIMSIHGILSNQVFIGQKTKFLVYLWSLSIQFRPTWSLSAILIQKYHVKVFCGHVYRQSAKGCGGGSPSLRTKSTKWYSTPSLTLTIIPNILLLSPQLSVILRNCLGK